MTEDKADKPQKRIFLDGFYINYPATDEAYRVIKYLRDDLSSSETKVFFNQARVKGVAPFEDERERKYQIVYRGGMYSLEEQD